MEQKHGEDWHPIALYASRSFKKIRNELLSNRKRNIVFACSKFHNYVYGRTFLVFNDHLPLKSIFKKSITKSPARIQRFLLRLQRYNFEMHYIRGTQLTVPDALTE